MAQGHASHHSQETRKSWGQPSGRTLTCKSQHQVPGSRDCWGIAFSRTQFHRNPSSKAGRQQVLRTSSLLRIGLQDPLEDVMAAQAPDGIVVDGVHTGAEGLLLQLGHPTSNQPTGHTQQQQQQQLQHGPGSSVFPGWWLTGARAGLRFWRDRVIVDRVQAV